MFTVVPPRYDLINRIITLGLDQQWRKKAIQTCLVSSPKHVLDLACGTGDLALGIAEKAKGKLEIVGLDYSQPMLDIAQRKAKQITKNKVTFVHGDASKLPFEDKHFDCVGISFAFRNLTYKNPLTKNVLAEVVRVLKPGGRFVIVESSQPELKVIRWLNHLYLRVFVVNVGFFLSGNKEAYRYLGESAAHFYTPKEVNELLIGSGFKEVSYRPLLFGASGLHVANK